MLTVCLGGLTNLNKDGFLMLLCIGVYVIAVSPLKACVRYAIVDMLVLLVVNVHEFGFFVTFPFLILLAVGDEQIPLRPWSRPILLLPCVVGFAFVAIFRGNADMALQIQASWREILSPWWEGVELYGIPSDVASEGAGLWGQTKANLMATTCGIPNVAYFIVELLTAFVVVVRLTLLDHDDEERLGVLSFLLTVQALSLTVVFPFFVDYCRLVGFWTLSSIVCFAVVPECRWQRTFLVVDDLPIKVGPLVSKFRHGLAICMSKVPLWVVVVMALFVGMSGIGFNLKFCLGRSVVGTLTHAFLWDVYKAHGDISSWFYGLPK